jgi:hypothetical protein
VIVDYSVFEGACFEKDGAEIYVVEKAGVDVLLIPRLQASGEILECDFETLDPALSFDDVKGLIYVVLLGNFLRRFFLGKVKFVKFKNLVTSEESQSVYLG